MPVHDAHLRLSCLLLGLPDVPAGNGEGGPRFGLGWLRQQVVLLAQDHQTEILIPRKLVDPVRTTRSVEQEVSAASFVLAEVSASDPAVCFYLGIARSQGKPLVLLRRFDAREAQPLEAMADFPIVYEDTIPGREEVTKLLRNAFEVIHRAAASDRGLLLDSDGGGLELESLSATGHENLCLELLLRQGFVEARWLDNGREVDLLALAPRPRGGHELHLISIGSGLADAFALQGWIQDIEAVARLAGELRDRYQLSGPDGRVSVALLFVWAPGEGRPEEFQVKRELARELGHRLKPLVQSIGSASQLRVRSLWSRQKVTAMVRSEPMLQRRYVSDDDGEVGPASTHGRAWLERRLHMEELYLQAVDLGHRAAEVYGRLERHLVEDPGLEWQERAYSVTHSIGNAIFPVETYVDLALEEFEQLGHAQGMENMRRSMVSIEKAKLHIRRFKAIARFEKPELQVVDIGPRLLHSLAPAEADGIRVTWYGSSAGPVFAEPDLFDEAIDELVNNSKSWLAKHAAEHGGEKQIVVTLKRPQPDDLPPRLQGRDQEYQWIRYEDSGPGVATNLKETIFDLFYSNNPQGMGYGLAIVRKNLRNFGGEILETGFPGQGVCFDIFLPLAPGEPRATGARSVIEDLRPAAGEDEEPWSGEQTIVFRGYEEED